MNRIELQRKLDVDARRFLAAVKYYGGKATTSEIRGRTGLSPSKTHSRYDVLEESGLIDVTYADHGHGDRDPPKIAHLTGQARTAIEWGILGDIDDDHTPEEINDLQSEARTAREERDELRERVNAFEDLMRQLTARVEDLEDDMDYMLQWGQDAGAAIRSISEQSD